MADTKTLPKANPTGDDLKLPQTDSRVQYRVGPILPGATPNDMGNSAVCGTCRFFSDDTCRLVAGEIDPRWTCNLWMSPSGQESAARTFIQVSADVFADGAALPEWIPFIPKPGLYKHPTYGDVEIDAGRTARLIASVQNKVYQEHIPLDLEHQTKLSGAAAWIRDMRLNEDGSADARVEWADRGRAAVEGGRFRYISPEWYRNWEDPTTGQIHQDIVVGGALTTRPFFKDGNLRALVASETGAEIIAATDPYWFRDFSRAERDQLAKEGKAQPDGSYPIETVGDLKNAIRTFGLGGATASDKAHIKSRARALGATDLLPEGWSEGDHMAAAQKPAPDDPNAPDAADKEEAQETLDDPNASPADKGKARATLAKAGAKMSEPTTTTTEPTQDPAPVAAAEPAPTPPAVPTPAAPKPVSAPAPAPVATAEPVAPKAPEVTATQFAELEQRFVTQGEQFAAQLLDAEKRATTAEQKWAALEADRQQERFTSRIRGNSEGVRWIGDPETHLILLTSLANKFGEESDEFTRYVTQQDTIAAQVKASDLFKEIGRGSGDGSATDPVSRIEALTQARMKDDGKLSHAEAYSQVLESPEGKRLYGEIPTRS